MCGVSVRNHDTGVAIARLAAILLAASLPATACIGQSCTLIGWEEGLSVHLTPSPLPAGRYDIEVVADREPIALAVTVTASGTSCDAEACSREVALDDGTALRLRFVYDGIAIATVGDDASGGPAEAVVTVRRDGVEIASDTFTPDYRREEINGPGCGWATTAEATLALD
jgi:hypothetical protein